MSIRTTASEADTLKAILDLLAAEGILAIRFNTGAFRMGKRFVRSHSAGPGLADILAFPTRLQRFDCGYLHGDIQPLWVEVKARGGKQSLEQASFQQLVEKNGHHYLVAWDAEDVWDWLKSRGVK